jgi:hypothetical protein
MSGLFKKKTGAELQAVGETVRNSNFKIPRFVILVLNWHSFPGNKNSRRR